MNWKILSSEYLFNDLWFKVRKDKCITPQGKIVDPYYVYEFPTWVTAVALTEDGKVVLEKQYRHALGETCIEIPGGFSSYEYLGKISANPSTNGNLMHMFLAKGGKKIASQDLDHNEEIEIDLVSIDELKQMLRENTIVQSMHVTCIMYALEKMGELKY